MSFLNNLRSVKERVSLISIINQIQCFKKLIRILQFHKLIIFAPFNKGNFHGHFHQIQS